MGKPPQFLFENATNRSKWNRKARLVLHAFQIYEDSLCSKCGQSAFHALDQLNTRAYVLDSVVCLGCACMDTYQRDHGDDKQEPGEKVFVANSMGATPS